MNGRFLIYFTNCFMNRTFVCLKCHLTQFAFNKFCCLREDFSLCDDHSSCFFLFLINHSDALDVSSITLVDMVCLTPLAFLTVSYSKTC